MFFRRNVSNNTTPSVVNVEDKNFLKWLGLDTENADILGTNSLKQSTVYACIKILADTISKLPIKIYQDQDGIKKSKDHSLTKLLKLRPNKFMSAVDFWKAVEIQRNLYGNAFVYIETDYLGHVTSLYPLEYGNITIMIDDINLIDRNNKIWYIYVTEGGEQVTFRQDEILHFKSLTTNGLVGISPIDQLQNLIQNGKASENYISQFFTNGLQVKGLVQYVGDLNPEAEENFRKNFERMSSGLKNSHRIAMLPLGYQFQPISQKLVDAQFLENKELNIRQIASVFGIKMHQLNDLNRATHTNIAEQQKEFYIDTLQSILTMYEQELTYKLFLQRELKTGYYLKFNVDAILRADIKSRYESYRLAVQNGFMTANEIRQLEEREAKPGGDELLINGNMIPVADAGKQYGTKGGGDNE